MSIDGQAGYRALTCALTLGLLVGALACVSPGATGEVPAPSGAGGSGGSDDGRTGEGGANAGGAGAGTSTGTGGAAPQAANAAAFPSGLAVASPTAIEGGAHFRSLQSSTLGPGAQAARRSAGRERAAELPSGTSFRSVTMQPDKSYAQKQAELEAIVNGTTAGDCELIFPPNPPMIFNPSCYGPNLDFENHPDGSPSSGQLPWGDLGLWNETEGDSEACAAAKLNSLVGDVAQKVDYGLYMAASLICVMNVSGTALPSVGESVDMTAELDASIHANNSHMSVSVAILERLADDAEGNPVYLYSLLTETSYGGGGEPVSMDTRIQHVAGVGDAGYEGKMWSQFEHLPGFLPRSAYSLRYQHEPGSLRYRLVAAGYDPNPATVFDADGDIALNGDWRGGITQGIFDLSPATGTASVSFAWQAGEMDDRSRVFNVFLEPNPTGATGCGFFGFGAPFQKSAPELPNNAIDRFICNWAGPGNSHMGMPMMAQKQCMERGQGGVFVPTESLIDYAPVNDCDTTADPAFGYRLAGESSFDHTPIASELVNLTVDPDFAKYVPPVSPPEL